MNLLRGAARLMLALLGWKLIDLPQRPVRAVVIGYPHTSNWDFPLGLLAIAALDIDARWVGMVDYPRREIGLVSSLQLSGNEAADMARIAACYDGRAGYHPENASPTRLL